MVAVPRVLPVEDDDSLRQAIEGLARRGGLRDCGPVEPIRGTALLDVVRAAIGLARLP